MHIKIDYIFFDYSYTLVVEVIFIFEEVVKKVT